MAIEVIVPRSGWSMEEGTFAGWLKNVGEAVKAGDRLFALESDKSIEEAETMDAGILWLPPGAPKTGDRVKVGQLLGYLLAPGETPPASANGSSPAPAAAPAQAAAPAAPAPAAAKPVPPPKVPTELGADIGGQVLPTVKAVAAAAPAAIQAPAASRAASTPRARRAAHELSKDLADVTGTGRGGRIRERDVRSAVSASAPDDQPVEAAVELDRPAAGGPSIPISRMRRTIAERMVRSLNETAPVTLATRGDASALVALRSQLKTLVPAAGPDGEASAPSYTEIIVKIVARALRRHPLLGGRWETDRIVLPAAINIGIAVDTEDGLLVPVVRDVDRTPLLEVSRRARTLVEAARKRQVRSEDLRGGVFTVTSLGSYGIDEFTPIINQPETAILGVGAIRKGPWVGTDGVLGVRESITLSLTFDHRIVDGAPAGAFLKTIREGIESPAAWALVDLPTPA